MFYLKSLRFLRILVPAEDRADLLDCGRWRGDGDIPAADQRLPLFRFGWHRLPREVYQRFMRSPGECGVFSFFCR